MRKRAQMRVSNPRAPRASTTGANRKFLRRPFVETLIYFDQSPSTRTCASDFQYAPGAA